MGGLCSAPLDWRAYVGSASVSAVAPSEKQTRKELLDTISLKQFNQQIPDEKAAIAFAEEQTWGDTPSCGRCGSENVYRAESGKPMSHRCRPCKIYFSVRTGTVMAETNLPIRTWLLATHLIHTARKGMSALQIHKLLGVAYLSDFRHNESGNGRCRGIRRIERSREFRRKGSRAWNIPGPA